MTPLQRASLPDQVAARLREGIASARWSEELPSEAELCRELHVSRDTLRRGIAQLAREGWLTPGGRGCHHRIRKQAAARGGSEGRIVRALCPYALTALGALNHAALDTLRERLGSAGFRLEFEHRPTLFATHSPDELARIDALPDTAGWVLFFSTEEIQRWFAARGRPSVVFGYTYPGIALPCVFLDTPAVGLHAAGLFYQRGHRELVYFIADFTSRSDRLCAERFVEEARRLGARARIQTYAPNVSDLRRVLRDTLVLKPRPTGFFASCPEHCLTILGHIQEAGLRVPADAALIAASFDLFLSYAVPSIAHYRIHGDQAGRHISTLLLGLLKHGAGKLRSVRILPEFLAGDTLGPAKGEPVKARSGDHGA